MAGDPLGEHAPINLVPQPEALPPAQRQPLWQRQRQLQRKGALEAEVAASGRRRSLMRAQRRVGQLVREDSYRLLARGLTPAAPQPSLHQPRKDRPMSASGQGRRKGSEGGTVPSRPLTAEEGRREKARCVAYFTPTSDLQLLPLFSTPFLVTRQAQELRERLTLRPWDSPLRHHAPRAPLSATRFRSGVLHSGAAASRQSAAMDEAIVAADNMLALQTEVVCAYRPMHQTKCRCTLNLFPGLQVLSSLKQQRQELLRVSGHIMAKVCFVLTASFCLVSMHLMEGFVLEAAILLAPINSVRFAFAGWSG